MTYHLPLPMEFHSGQRELIVKTKEQIQKEIQAVQALKLAPSLIEDLCQIVEDNFKNLDI